MCHGVHSSERAARRERRRTVVSVSPPSKKPALAEMPEWIVVDFECRGFKCERCGTSERDSTPKGVSRLEAFMLRGRAFAIEHAGCEKPEVLQ